MSSRRTTYGIAAAVGAVAAAGAGLVGAGYYWLLRRPLPRTRGTLQIRGLERPVEILRDRWGVPHIYADTIHDLLFAQGFVHAQDRLWQMDFQRRLVAGRLSEVLGSETVAVDRWVRTLTMRRVAEQEADLLEEDVRAALEAYAAGVSARIERRRLPVEFTLLRYRPEPWVVADTLAWIKFMSWILSGNWEAEILRALLIQRLGPELAAELEPGAPDQWPTITAGAEVLGGFDGGEEALRRAEEARRFTGPGVESGVGSNSWVVAGAGTNNGAPLLANDMHLLMSLPCIWYENHLVGGNLNVTGVTFPGIPGVIAGHNGHVAWGFTNGFADVQDLFMERLRRVDGDAGQGGRVQYEYQGEWRDAEVLREEIRVKGGETVVEEVIVTHHGPIINSLAPDLVGEVAEGQPLALRWTSLEPDNMINALWAVARSRNCLEFREALRYWTAPVQNVVYADVEGNIGYSFPGKVPIRAKGDGRVPVPGWTGEYEWTGYIPFEELPHVYNPSHGYVATANNRIVDDSYPHELGRDYGTGIRAQRIVELLEARDGLDLAYCQRMQLDLVSVYARFVAVYLSELETEDPGLAEVVALMRRWDGTLAAGSAAAAVYEVFIRRLIQRTLEGKLGDLAVRYAGLGPTPALAEGSMFASRSAEWLLRILDDPDSPWFDLGNGETGDDVLRLVLAETVDFLKAELGPEIEDWAWGKLHTLTYNHALGQVKPLDRLFNRGPYPLGGDGGTVWATGASYHDLDSGQIVGPPFRFVADLSDLGNAVGLLSPGQSGQPGSPHYDDQIQAWFSGEYHPMLYRREDVVRETRSWLELLPKRARRRPRPL